MLKKKLDDLKEQTLKEAARLERADAEEAAGSERADAKEAAQLERADAKGAYCEVWNLFCVTILIYFIIQPGKL
ncbi:unnamed protein product [Sphagnum balticum]